MSDFMGGMFDFNGDDHTDTGEEFMAYQIHEDMMKDDSGSQSSHHVSSGTSSRSGIKLWHIILAILLIIWQISCMTNPYNRYSGSSSYRSGSQYKYSSSSSSSKKSSSSKQALTKDEADALRGTGYHNTRPNSSAENMELAAAQVKCKRCGMHSSNGYNSMCNSCRKITGGY